jgi:hypothetical protein
MMQRQPEFSREKSLGELFTDLTQEIVTLIRQEMTLVKAEMSRKAANLGTQVGLLFAGGALAYAGALAIVAAIVLLLIRAGLQPWASALIVGVVVTVCGAGLAMKAIAAIKNEDLTPRETVSSLKQLKDDIR